MQLLQIGVANQFLCRDNISLYGSCCNTVTCIVRISVAAQKVCRDRVLLPLNLISCYNFILMSRPSLLCRDQASLPCVGIFVTT